MTFIANKTFTCFDANATEPLRPEARVALLDAASLDGNPASPHRAGRIARDRLEQARGQLASCFGADAQDVVFTSGGTEANVLALHETGRRVLAGATEHASILETAAGLRIVAVDKEGLLRLDVLEEALRTGGPSLVAVMLANNETGVLHPIGEIAALCRRYDTWLHVDAAQAAGRVALEVGRLGADSVALSGHKLGGPKGAGALLLSGARRGALPPLIAGGGQERGRRGGTPALPAIAGFAAAAEAAMRDLETRGERLRLLRDRIEAAAAGAGAIVCGRLSPRLPNTSCLIRPGRRSEGQLIALDLAGFGVSAGSACSSGRVARSHVLEAMGFGEAAGQAIRVSLPWNTEPGAVETFIGAYLALA